MSVFSSVAKSLIPVFVCLATCLAAAQQPARQQPHASSPNSATQPQGSDSTAAFPPPSASSNQELTHASNESAGRTPQAAASNAESVPKEEQDEEAAFKFSPAVQWISKITGLSLVAAYWACVALNFAIVAIAILLFLKSSLPAMFRGRTQEIQKGIEEARRSSADAGRRLLEIENRLSRLGVEIDDMQKHAEAESRAEEERILASIAEEKKKIVEAAEQEIGQASNVARRELQKYAADLAVSIAEKSIRIDPAEDKLLVDDFVQQLGSQPGRNGNG
jgi:F-type H+-transporting ATPase subunit b